MLSPHFSLDSFFRISVAQYNIYGHKSKLLFIMFSVAIRIPIAIGKSKVDPSFRIFAGERFITTFLLKNSKPEFFIAVFILSNLSCVFQVFVTSDLRV